MITAAARRSMPGPPGLRSMDALLRAGFTEDAVRAQIAARRWQRAGRIIVLHGGPLTSSERQGVALLNCGPRAVLTAFSAAQVHGLQGWERSVTHVLVPGGARVRRLPGAPVRLHYSGEWSATDRVPGKRLHRCAAALVLAAGTMASPRPACGILAAGVQQAIVTADELQQALDASTRTRHRRLLATAIADIGQGAHALSEIDFVRLCGRAGIPAPVQQAVRREPSGRRRYLDAEWARADGRRVVAEVDGALHLSPHRWWADQLRQNELAISGDLVLRFPSVVIRTEPALVIDQLRRMLT